MPFWGVIRISRVLGVASLIHLKWCGSRAESSRADTAGCTEQLQLAGEDEPVEALCWMLGLPL